MSHDGQSQTRYTGQVSGCMSESNEFASEWCCLHRTPGVRCAHSCSRESCVRTCMNAQARMTHKLQACARLWHAYAMLCSIKLHECEHVLMNVLYTAQCDAQWEIKQLTWGAPSTWLGARVYLLDDEILAMGLLCKRTETLDSPSWQWYVSLHRGWRRNSWPPKPSWELMIFKQKQFCSRSPTAQIYLACSYVQHKQ